MTKMGDRCTEPVYHFGKALVEILVLPPDPFPPFPHPEPCGCPTHPPLLGVYPNNPIKTRTEEPTRQSSKEDIQVAKKHTKRCLTSLITREKQIKTTMRYHITPVRIAVSKKSTHNKCWQGCGEKGASLHCWWECVLVQPLWKTACK